MSTKTKKKTSKDVDVNSIRTITMLYFLLFALALILFIWFLQNYFMNNFYEQMKAQETRESVASLEGSFYSDADDFSQRAASLSMNNGVFIRLDSEYGTRIFDNGVEMSSDLDLYKSEIRTANRALAGSELGSVALKVTDSNNNSRLVFAKLLNDPNASAGSSEPAVLYIIAALFPPQSTISIMRQQLFYISLIALVVAAVLSVLMAKRLAAPIGAITESARELSKGNYNVKFNGGGFTETNELASTLNKASYEMQKTDFYQKDLIANVSHDLKTPLTMIRSYAEMINDISGDNPVKRTEHLHVIIQEADRLNKLVSDMLSVSRLQSNRVQLDKKEFDLVETANEVLDTFEILNEQANYNIMPVFCKSAAVFGDEARIKQVMSNLISNAIKYCGEDKFVKIEIKKNRNNKVRFSVVDHGEGIAADEIGHVWDRYYRTSANRNTEVEGTGLGLSIVKGILTLHNADYGVDSKVGEGSDFWFEMDLLKKPKTKRRTERIDNAEAARVNNAEAAREENAGNDVTGI